MPDPIEPSASVGTQPELYTAEEVAALMRVSVGTVVRHSQRNKIPGRVKGMHLLRFRVVDVRAWLGLSEGES